MKAYKNHLFNNSFITHASFTFQYISGKEATNIPTAGTGNPLNENAWLLSKLNLANRYAAAQGNSKAGINQSIETSSPSSCCEKLNLRNWYMIMPGATPKLTRSASE